MTFFPPLNSITAVAAYIAATAAWAQWNFTLDTTFRTNIEAGYVTSMYLREDDRLIISGGIEFPGEWGERGGALLNNDGSWNTDFAPVVYASGLLVPWQDRLYVGNAALVRRMGMDGYLDPSFISMNSGPYFQSLQGGDFHVYPDGRILISGNNHLEDSIRGFEGLHQLIWFSSEGYLDTTQTHRRGDGAIYAFDELSDGGFICYTVGESFEQQLVDAVFKVHADGSLDTTFHTGIWWGWAQGYLPLPDGRVYAYGRFQTIQAPGDTSHVIRLLPDGTLDPTFTPPEFNISPISAPMGPMINHIFPLGKEHLIVAGQFTSVEGQPRRGLCLIDTTGQLLQAFHDQGVSPVQFGNLTYGGVQRILPNADTTALYISGKYEGYNDGNINDPEQGYVSRLLVEEVSVSTPDAENLPSDRGSLLHLYPNPSTGMLTVEYEQSTRSDLVLLLSDLQGRTLLRRQLNGSSARTHIDVGSLDPGAYLVQLQTSDGVVLTDRLIVQR